MRGPLFSEDLPYLRCCAKHLTHITLSNLPCLPYKVGSLRHLLSNRGNEAPKG